MFPRLIANKDKQAQRNMQMKRAGSPMGKPDIGNPVLESGMNPQRITQ